MVKVQILEVRPIRIPQREGEVIVYKICYRYGDVLSSCIWIDEDKFNPDNIKEYIRADLEKQMKVIKGELEI